MHRVLLRQPGGSALAFKVANEMFMYGSEHKPPVASWKSDVPSGFVFHSLTRASYDLAFEVLAEAHPEHEELQEWISLGAALLDLEDVG